METDQEKLLAAALQGDSIALQQMLLQRYEQLTVLIREKIPAPLQSAVDVEDVLQMTFVQVFRGLAKFTEGDSEAFYAWVRAIADAKAVDAIRNATRKKRGGDWRRVEHMPANASESVLDLMLLLSDGRRTPSSSVATHEAIAALQIALAGLPEDQREAIRLRHIDCLTMEEVVEKMERSEGAVRGLLHRGKSSLKKSLGNSSAWFSKTQ